MTNEELNTALYKKVFAEQEKYREWLEYPKNDLRQNQNCGRSSSYLGQWSAGRVQGLSLAEQSRRLLVPKCLLPCGDRRRGCVPTGLCGGGRPAF